MSTLEEAFRQLMTTEPDTCVEIYTRLRERAQRYREFGEQEEAVVITRLTEELDLTPIQVGRLQMLVRHGGDRIRALVIEHDAQNPALHPLEKVDHE